MPSPTSRLRLLKQAPGSNFDSWGTQLNAGALDIVDEAFGLAEITVGADVTLDVENYLTDEARRLVLHLTGAGGFTVTTPAVDKPYLVVNDCSADVTITPSGGTGVTVRAGVASWVWCDGTNGKIVDTTLDKIATAAADVALGGNKLTGVGAGTASTDAATLSNRPEQFATPTGPLAMGGQKITGVGAATASTDAASLANRLDQFAAPTADVAFNAQKITGLANGSIGTQDAAPVAQVESLIASATVNLPAQTGNAGRFLTTDGTTPAWDDIAVADVTGAVAGPASATNNNVPQFDGTTGKLLKNGLTVGTAASNLVQLDGSARLPAVDASQLINLPVNSVFELVGSIEAADDASLTITWTGAAGLYLLVGNAVRPAASAQNLLLRWGSGSIATVNYFHHTQTLNSGASTYSANISSSTSVMLVPSADSTYGNTFAIWLPTLAGTYRSSIHGTASKSGGTGGAVTGGSNNSGLIDRAQIFMSSGNITSGTFSVYRLKTS